MNDDAVMIFAFLMRYVFIPIWEWKYIDILKAKIMQKIKKIMLFVGKHDCSCFLWYTKVLLPTNYEMVNA